MFLLSSRDEEDSLDATGERYQARLIPVSSWLCSPCLEHGDMFDSWQSVFVTVSRSERRRLLTQRQERAAKGKLTGGEREDRDRADVVTPAGTQQTTIQVRPI